MTTPQEPTDSAAELAAVARLGDALGIAVPADLLLRAVTHRSYAYENGGLPTNERLEFLGDAVLGLIITDALFATHPHLTEGHLAKLRAATVNARALAQIARELQLGEYVRLGRGELVTGGRDKSSILADTLEALIGAIYLGAGLSVATDVVLRLFGPTMDQAGTLGAGLDWKTSLQELASQYHVGVPGYEITEDGPDHAKTFQARVVIDGERFGFGEGRSKKEAEQLAAATAYDELTARFGTPDA